MNVLHNAVDSWRTTLAGAISAASAIGIPLIVAGNINATEIYVAIGLAFLGAICKDPGRA